MEVVEKPVSKHVPKVVLLKMDLPKPAYEGATKFYDKNETVVMYRDQKLRNGDILRIEQAKPIGPGYCGTGEPTTMYWEHEGWKRKDAVDANEHKRQAESLRLAEIEKREAELAKREADTKKERK